MKKKNKQTVIEIRKKNEVFWYKQNVTRIKCNI